jgi:ABC-type Fe3+-siderophore transport system permease subunit
MNSGLPIVYVCAFSGLAIIVGSFLLLWTQRIYLDHETKQVIEIELPLGIKLKSNLPVVTLILIGGALLIYAVSESQQFSEEVTADGNLTGSTSSVQVYASIASAALPNGGTFSLPLPVTHPSRKYMLLYTVNGDVLAHQDFDPAADNGKSLPAFQITLPSGPQFVGEIQPKPPGY